MKLSEMKPCPGCGEAIAPFIYEVTIKRHMVNPGAVNRTLGLNQMFGGDALGLAEIMGPDRSVTQEFDSFTAMLCQDCAMPTFALIASEEDDDEGEE